MSMTRLANFAYTDLTGAAPVQRQATIYRHVEMGEFVVQFYRNGVHHPEADYFTGSLDDDCLQDAIGTARNYVFPAAVRARALEAA